MLQKGFPIALLALNAAMPAWSERPGDTPAYTATIIPSVMQSPYNPYPWERATGVNNRGEALIAACRGRFGGAGCSMYLWSPRGGIAQTSLHYMLDSCRPNLSLVPGRINERGEIGGNICGSVYVWSARSGVTQLATLNPFSIYDQVVAFTERGEIGGTTFFGPYYAAYYASARTGVVILPFATTSRAVDMNDHGEMIGDLGFAGSGAFYWSLSTGLIPIQTGGTTIVRSIARDGTVLGVTQAASGESSLFLWRGQGGVTATAPLGTGCTPYRATSSGLVVGSCGGPYPMHMWTWTARTGYSNFELIPGGSLNAMNDKGQVVGTIGDYSTGYAFLWSADTGFVNLDPGRTDRTSSALSIAEDGTIGGSIGVNAAVWSPEKKNR
jgi:hypothetical protein